MKKSIFATAALLVFGLAAPQVKATTTLFTLTGGSFSSVNGVANSVLTFSNGSGFQLTLTGYNCQGQTLCDAAPTQTDTATALHDGSTGVGMANDQQGTVYEIPRNEFVQVAISATPSNTTITGLAFNFVSVVDGWDIYTSATAGKFSTTGTNIAQGNNQSDFTLAQDPLINSTIAKNATTGSSTFSTNGLGFFNVSALQADCETLLNSITLTYTNTQAPPSAPEPATCVLMGAALVGLGVVRKKIGQRS